MKSSYEDHLGFDVFSIRAAQKRGEKLKKHNIGSVVPTRKEVVSLNIDKLQPLLVAWMCHSEPENMPSKTQILDVIDILRQREDAAAIAPLISMCHNYMRDE